jgi:hypothetical protein
LLELIFWEIAMGSKKSNIDIQKKKIWQTTYPKYYLTTHKQRYPFLNFFESEFNVLILPIDGNNH